MGIKEKIIERGYNAIRAGHMEVDYHKQDTRKALREDLFAVGRNLRDKHDFRFAGMMAISGFNLPLKAILETSTKTFAGFLYDAFPAFYQEGLSLIHREIPEFLHSYFTTEGDDMSDLTSIYTRLFSLGMAYVTTDLVVCLREKAFEKARLNEEKRETREVAKSIADLGSVAVIGVPWTYAKYKMMQSAAKEVNESARALATGSAVLFDAAAQPVKGYLLDVCCDPSDYKKSERTPGWFKNMSKRSRRNFLYGSLAASSLLTAGWYAVNPAPFFPANAKDDVSIEEAIEENRKRGLGRELIGSNERVLDERDSVRGLEDFL